MVVNKWLPDVFDDEAPARVLDALEDDAAARRTVAEAVDGGGAGEAVDDWVDALGHVRAQRRENLTFLRKLEGLDAPVSLVPLLPHPEARLQRVAEALKTQTEVADVLEGVAP